MTHLYVWRVTWLICVCDVWNDAFIWRLIRVKLRRQLQVLRVYLIRHDSSLSATCDMTHSYEDSSEWSSADNCKCCGCMLFDMTHLYVWRVTRLICMCDVWLDSFVCVTCDMTHLYVWRVTRLIHTKTHQSEVVQANASVVGVLDSTWLICKCDVWHDSFIRRRSGVMTRKEMQV